MIPQKELKFKDKISFDFNGGELTTDGGFFLLFEYFNQIGVKQHIDSLFHIKGDSPSLKFKSQDLLLQFVSLTCLGYHNQDHADALRCDPALADCFNVAGIASQPTFSRFDSRLTPETERQVEAISQKLLDRYYEANPPEYLIMDLDTTYLNAFGQQEGKGFNGHYQTEGLSALQLFDHETAFCLKSQLRPGTTYCSKEAGAFLEPLLEKQQKKYGTSLTRLLRGDSGFASPEIYDVCESTETDYLIRLKENARLVRKADEIRNKFFGPFDFQSQTVLQGEFQYQASSWSRERRVVVEITKAPGSLVWDYTFLVTTLKTQKTDLIFSLYRKRGSMENYIKEAKNGFGIHKNSQKSLASNGTKLQAKMLAYNLVRMFSLTVLPKPLQHHRVETLRNKLFKLAGRRVKSGRRIMYRFASSFPLKALYGEVLEKISKLRA